MLALINRAVNKTASCGKIARESFLGGLIFVEKGIPRKLRNLYTLKISTHTVVYP